MDYDAIVVGTGHAGAEAALALARTGAKTIALSVSLDNVGYLACNPSIGGTGKGHLVRELDAMGGFMGIAADECCRQMRMLNSSKGLAVRSLRAQEDKYKYHEFVKSALESCDNLTLRQGEVKTVVKDKGGFIVTVASGLSYRARAVVFACGVYLDSTIIIGSNIEEKGPACFARSHGLSDSLRSLGFKLRRFKTGTPARINADSVNFSAFEVQHGEHVPYTFSDRTTKKVRNDAVCYLGYTNERTHEIIRKNIHLAPKYSGLISGTGARYCPSIEDKVVRFADKTRHAFFLEPEGESTKELYVQGISSSLPASVQLELYRSIEGFEKVEIMRDAYAIEYECIDARCLHPTLMSKDVEGLFFAGQINGTSGYEEAAAQGFVAGANAALYLQNKPLTVFKRTESYIGVMCDDLVTVGTDEPYRMLTGRAECRLSLRQDNADLRLTKLGYNMGQATAAMMDALKDKEENIKKAKARLSEKLTQEQLQPLFERAQEDSCRTMTVREVLKRPNITLELFNEYFTTFEGVTAVAVIDVYASVRYGSYLKRQEAQLQEADRLESATLAVDTDYRAVKGLRSEAAEKLMLARPSSIGQASRISGVTPADIWVLITALKK